MTDIGDRINELLDNEYLTEKHRNTVESFRRGLLKWGSLSVRQVDYFNSIAKNYSEEKIQQRASFGRRLREDKEYCERLRVVAEYYNTTGYYRRIVSDVLAYLNQPDKDLVSPPRFEDVEKMMGNKYAENVLSSHFGAEKFAVGEMVQLRASLSRDNIKSDSNAALRKYTWGSKQMLKTSTFLIVKVNSSPISRSLSYDAKRGGTRWYELLPLGDTATIEACEKELKRPTAKLLRGE
tara:strand:- start:79 stop:789 length:711 start_codon:yes stop_codon:yes gene_type:complete